MGLNGPILSPVTYDKVSSDVTSKKGIFQDVSLWVLLLSNVITIIFALTEHLDFRSIVLIFWFQNIAIGFFNVMKILPLGEYELASFFTLHYGFFHIVWFIMLLYTPYKNGLFIGDSQSTHPDFAMFIPVAIPMAVLFLNHAFSYFYNKPLKPMPQKSMENFVLLPYFRIIPMHLALGLSTIFPAPISVFLVLKTLADMGMHIVQHKVFEKEQVTA